MTLKITRGATLSLLLAAAPLPALAQAGGAPTPPPATTEAPAPKAAGPARKARPTPQTPQARVEARIAQLHQQLHITGQEQSAWDQFAQAMRDNAQAMDQALQDRADKMATMNAVESLQSYETLAELHAANVKKLIAAFQPLYDSLSETQKQAADKAFRPHARNRTRR